MTSQEQPYRAAIYAAVLKADAPSPLAPLTADEEVKSDADEKGGDEGDAADEGDETEAEQEPSIDVEGLASRIVALPLGERSYVSLLAAKDGGLYYIRTGQPGDQNPPAGQRGSAENQLMRYDIKAREVKSVMRGVTGLWLSPARSHLLINKGGSWHVAKAGAKLNAKPVKTSDMQLYVDPKKEWAQILTEAWRMEKSYFYDPNMHGLDWDGVLTRYSPLVAHVGRREDLSALMVEMIGELEVGHNRTGGGDIVRAPTTSTGLLGANFVTDDGFVQIAKIYTSGPWNPGLSGPLAGVDVDANVGDYILAVNGRPLTPQTNLFQLLEGTAGKQTRLTVANTKDGTDARDITVIPARNEGAIRLWDWVENNRRAVEDASDGRVGYIYLPNTAGAGYTFFNRMFFAQVDKDAMIIDERSNGGGQAANYITDVLSRTYLAGWKDSVGQVYNTPGAAMYGPKVMLIDQDAGSGGDFLPYSFRHMGIGPLIGTRTWGGLIGISANPPLMDGGFLTVPNFRFFNPDYEWRIENEGVAPDIEVALDPLLTNAGRDSQLERALEEVLRRLETDPSPIPTEAPPYPTELGS